MRNNDTFICDFCEKKSNNIKDVEKNWYLFQDMKKYNKHNVFHFCSKDCVQFFVINIFMRDDYANKS